MIGDTTGLVANLWYRGMNLIHIPTTLIAMIDLGKCAVNFGKTINALGAYHHPIANFIDLRLLLEMPEREFNSGLAEIIKCALIGDERFFNYLMREKSIIKLETRKCSKKSFRELLS